ncbi:uncharacterized protein [Nicotiana sylvestris]|uniref:uncharacterized protein n=1 Tax=Nicotiana sylvestris TaxID=4096 RepID=UPI00388CEB4F
MVGKGCLLYLTFVRDIGVDTPTIDYVPVLQDFLDVFPADIAGKPLKRDIDLVPGTQRISIPLYRMVIAELKELKEQLQELLDKEFIRLSISLGANVVVDALNRKAVSMGSLAFIPIGKKPLAVDVQALANMFVRLDVSEPNQHGDSKDITIGDDGVLRIHGRICVANVDMLREFILEEAHNSREARLLGTNLVKDALDKVKLIQDHLHTAWSRQKSYANRKVRDVAYIVGEKVLLKISPMKDVMRFGKKRKLIPHYIGPFEYVSDPCHVLDFSTVQLDGDLTYVVEPVAILGPQVLKLRSKDIDSVKV